MQKNIAPLHQWWLRRVPRTISESGPVILLYCLVSNIHFFSHPKAAPAGRFTY